MTKAVDIDIVVNLVYDNNIYLKVTKVVVVGIVLLIGIRAVDFDNTNRKAIKDINDVRKEKVNVFVQVKVGFNLEDGENENFVFHVVIDKGPNFGSIDKVIIAIEVQEDFIENVEEIKVQTNFVGEEIRIAMVVFIIEDEVERNYLVNEDKAKKDLDVDFGKHKRLGTEQAGKKILGFIG